MYKLKKQIEGQIQEIVFFFSLLMAFSTFLSGIFYLTLAKGSLSLILGSFGANIDQFLFSFLGYGFFYLSVISLHMGYVTNFHVFNFRDFKREAPVLLQSAIAHLILLTLFSNLLSVIQISLEIPATQSLPNGSGGALGAFIGRGLYGLMGIYGSIIVIAALMLVTCLLASFFEITDVLNVSRQLGKKSQKFLFRFAKKANRTALEMIHFFLKGNEISEMALQSSTATKTWISNSVHRANHLFTEHLHIYKRDMPKTTLATPTKVESNKSMKRIIAKTSSDKLIQGLKKTSISPLIAKKQTQKNKENLKTKAKRK